MKQIHSIDDLKGYTGLVLFSAPWCGPCKTYRPVLEAFALNAKQELRLVDIDVNRDMAGTYGIRSVPTTMYFVNGSPFAQMGGAQPVASLQRLLPNQPQVG